MRISKKQKPLTSKRRSSSQAEVFRESSKVGLLPSHFRMMGRLTGTFDDYVKSDFRDWASELRVLCGLIRPELIADAKDFRGQAFKDVPLRELPLNFNLATSQEPVDFVRIGMRVGNILIRAERIWTWSMITVCDTSASATEKPPTREEVITLVQRYFRYPLDTWGLVPDSKAAKANTPYFELLRVMTPLFQE